MQPRQACSEPNGNKPGQYIAAPRRGEAFVATIDQENLTVRSGNHRGRPLQEDSASCGGGKQTGRGHSIVSGQRSSQRSELTIVRS